MLLNFTIISDLKIVLTNNIFKSITMFFSCLVYQRKKKLSKKNLIHIHTLDDCRDAFWFLFCLFYVSFFFAFLFLYYTTDHYLYFRCLLWYEQEICWQQSYFCSKSWITHQLQQVESNTIHLKTIEWKGNIVAPFSKLKFYIFRGISHVPLRSHTACFSLWILFLHLWMVIVFGDRNFNAPQHQTHYRLFTSGIEHNALRWLPSSRKMTLSLNW